MYRWAPGNKATAMTEPAPSELLKATGILPACDEKGRNRQSLNRRGGSALQEVARNTIARVIDNLFMNCSHAPMEHPTNMPPADLSSEKQPGQILARGVCRHMISHGFATVEEFVPSRGLRVDVMALGPKGELWVIECKSSREDFTSDKKWQGYLDWCDRYFWAVDADFPTDLLPQDSGLILADAYDAEIIRMAPESKLAPARRKALTHKFATHAARRLHALRDPGAAAFISNKNGCAP